MQGGGKGVLIRSQQSPLSLDGRNRSEKVRHFHLNVKRTKVSGIFINKKLGKLSNKNDEKKDKKLKG
jgi:hypothetical protein